MADDEDDKPKRAARAPRPAAAVGAGAGQKEPGWVTAVGILGFLVLVWGFLICYSVSQEVDPTGSSFTSLFAEQKK